MFILNLFFHYQNTKNSIDVDLPLWGVLYSWPLHETSLAVAFSEEEEATVPFVGEFSLISLREAP